MIRLVVAFAIIVLFPLQLAHSAETTRGNIALGTTAEYTRAIESCLPLVKTNEFDAYHGPQFVDCLKQQVRGEAAVLDEVYRDKTRVLKSISPGQVERLRQAQRAWLQFQKTNCEFARVIESHKSGADELFFDCVLMSTIERHIELKNLLAVD